MIPQHAAHPSNDAIIAELRAMRETIAQLCMIHGARMTRAQVCERIGVHRGTLKRYIDSGIFPRPGLDGNWSLADIIQWEGRRLGDKP